MKLLLDSHVVLWALENSHRLPEHIKDMILDENNDIYVSVVSLWELSLKHKKNPEALIYDGNLIKEYCQKAGFYFLSLSVENIYAFNKLDMSMHKDPFDQMLVAQSVSANMRLISHDNALQRFGLGCIELF